MRDHQRQHAGELLNTQSASPLQFLASCPRGLGDLLARELTAFGAQEVRERANGVTFAGTLATAYRACLGSRIANRIFLELACIEAATADEFYAAARGLDWSRHLAAGATLACDFSGRHPTITHTHFGALRLKDAIVDSLRAQAGVRPDIELDRPSVRVHAHARGTQITVSIDLSGDSLHRRGYRGAAGEAPLKENVAAGVLMRAGWPEQCASGAEFLDPMCGSGTLVIEAALMAAGRAPGLSRKYFGFLGWRGHDAQLWAAIRQEAESRASPVSLPAIRGQDRDAAAIGSAHANAARAGVATLTTFEVKALAQAAPLEAERPGLLCVNPPYGVRMEDQAGARAVHRELGEVLRARFQGWNAAVLTGAPELGMELGIRAHRTHVVWNGAIECRLLRMKIAPESVREPGTLGRGAMEARDSPGARMFANRLGKNLKRLRSWVSKEGVSCYRIYDADMPEYAFAIDRYRTFEPQADWLYVQEYAAPADIELDAVRRRRREALSVLPEVTGVPPERIRVRLRRRTKRGEQYGKLGERAHQHVVEEGGLKFHVNFDDYQDTGLFLDHRDTRSRLRAASHGKRFLNLFAYTGTATVYAAAGGAPSSTSVDLSRTYLEWARSNLALNRLAGSEHVLIQADCREWLQEAVRGGARYDLIFLDPPTFSNSKRMEGVLDIERDHGELIDACTRLLDGEGLLVFSTNAQRFRLDAGVTERFAVEDISAATLPRDFERNPRIHRCFEIRRRGAGEAGAAASGSSSGRQGFPSRSSI
jgi:23S rRNA (guanine2445-N2)-methyltransferase / 23S rRNA (guanine2069-N7)-methyltransferase